MDRMLKIIGVCATFLMPSLVNATFVSPIAGDLQEISLTPPQQATAAVIEFICPQGQNNLNLIVLNQDLNNRCDELVVGGVGGGDIPGAQDGLQGMADEEDSVVQTTQVGTQQESVDAIAERLGNVRTGAIAGTTSVSFSIDGQPVNPGEYARDSGLGSVGQSAGDGTGGGGWSFFVDGNFANGDRDATQRESGFDMDSYQVTGGADYPVASDWILGAAVSYAHLDADVDDDGGSLDSDGYGIFGYATYYPNANLYVDAVIGYSSNDIDQERNIRYSIAAVGGGTTNVDKTAFSSTDSDEFWARLALGYDFYSGDWTYGPYGRIQYAEVEIDGFRESIPLTGGSGAVGSGLAVEIDDQDFTSVPLVLGLHAMKAVDMSWGTLYPRGFAEYVHEFENDSEDITGRFVGDPTGTTFFLPTDGTDRSVFGLGVGMTADFGQGRSAHFTYQTVLGYKHITLNVFELGVRLQF